MQDGPWLTPAVWMLLLHPVEVKMWELGFWVLTDVIGSIAVVAILFFLSMTFSRR